VPEVADATGRVEGKCFAVNENVPLNREGSDGTKVLGIPVGGEPLAHLFDRGLPGKQTVLANLLGNLFLIKVKRIFPVDAVDGKKFVQSEDGRQERNQGEPEIGAGSVTGVGVVPAFFQSANLAPKRARASAIEMSPEMAMNSYSRY